MSATQHALASPEEVKLHEGAVQVARFVTGMVIGWPGGIHLAGISDRPDRGEQLFFDFPSKATFRDALGRWWVKTDKGKLRRMKPTFKERVALWTSRYIQRKVSKVK